MEDKIKQVQRIFIQAYYGSTSDTIYFMFRDNRWYIEQYHDEYWIWCKDANMGVSNDFKNILSFLKALKKIEG